jgi:dGTPase
MQELSVRMQAANALLAPFAVPLVGTLGRELGEKPDATRFPFQRDRDRIIHTQAFRRLKHKTQVFVASLRPDPAQNHAEAGFGWQAGKGDHYRTRLTHTMEVAQISRDMARTLSLNEDLAECIALAHDLGHTPFGHAGEDQMREEMERYGGSFEHNLQSLRVVTLLEERSKRYHGLNLNKEVLEGLMKHRTPFDGAQGDSNGKHGHGIPRSPSLEAQIVNLADEIAYIAHDTDDGLRADVIRVEDLKPVALFREAHGLANANGTEARGSIIHLLVSDAYEETEKRLKGRTVRTLEEVYTATTPLVSFSGGMTVKLTELREFLWDHFYQASAVLQYSEKGKEIVHRLFRTYEKNPPEKVQALQEKLESTLPEAVKDYIAGMTDPFASLMATSIGER